MGAPFLARSLREKLDFHLKTSTMEFATEFYGVARASSNAFDASETRNDTLPTSVAPAGADFVARTADGSRRKLTIVSPSLKRPGASRSACSASP